MLDVCLMWSREAYRAWVLDSDARTSIHCAGDSAQVYNKRLPGIDEK